MMDDREIMALHADVLFTYDARGRMQTSNEPDGGPAPRLLLGCSMNGSVVRFGQTVTEELARRVTEIIAHQLPAGTFQLPVAVVVAVREALESQAPVTEEGGGPVYRFPPAIPRTSETVRLTDANLELARETYPWLLHELEGWWPCFAVVRDGAAVSICFSSRIGPRACEAGVETIPAFRGRGYAATVTAAWAASIRDTGRIPLYSTSWENLASQGVASRLGLTMVGADVTWT